MQSKRLCKVNLLKPHLLSGYLPFTLHNFWPTLIRTAKKAMPDPYSSQEDYYQSNQGKYFQ